MVHHAFMLNPIHNHLAQPLVWLLFAVLFGVSPPGLAHCKLQPIPDHAAGFQTVVGELHQEGGDGDVAKPAWLGPIRAGQCTLDSELFHGPLALADARYLFVVSYSGSTQWLTAYDLKTCRQHWRSAALFGQISLQTDAYHYRAAEADYRFIADKHCHLRQHPGR